jgi:hypothetical protein
MFNRYATYTLILEGGETQTICNQYAVTIDLAFQNEFFDGV